MSKYIKYIPTIDRTDLPKEVKGWLNEWVRENDVVQSNDSYIWLNIDDYRQYIREGAMVEYVEDYGPDKALFMEWLEKQTSADEVLILYWW